MRTLVKTFILGALSIALINAGLFFLLKAFGAGAVFSFSVLLLVSLASLFALGCILHLRLENHKSESFRADLGEVIQLQQTENNRVSPISVESQRAASGKDEPEEENESVLDRTGVFVTDPKRGTLIEAAKVAKKAAPAVAVETAESNLQEEEELESEEESGNEAFSIPDILQDIHAQGSAISQLLRDSQSRIHEIEKEIPVNLFSDEQEVISPLVDARRILNALDRRCGRLRGVITSQDSRALLKARRMLAEPLIIPADAVGSLMSSSELPSLLPNEWDAKVNELLSSAEQQLSGHASKEA